MEWVVLRLQKKWVLVEHRFIEHLGRRGSTQRLQTFFRIVSPTELGEG